MQNLIKRNDAIDLIRGYFLFVIIIDHLYRFFCFYDLFTGGGTQWVSAAEGFFFVSGMMIGLVRGRKAIDKPLSDPTKKLLSRAALLYVWSIGLTFLFVVVGHYFMGNEGLKPGMFYGEPLSKLISYTLLLRYTYGWADFLAYYVIYLALSPVAIWLLRKGKWYVLMGITFLMWMFIGRNIQLSWHLLFFWGAVAGFYLPEIENWFKSLNSRLRKILSVGLISIASITLAISLFFNAVLNFLRSNPGLPRGGINVDYLYWYNSEVLAPIFDKYTLAYGRLLLFLLWFSALYLVARRFEKPLTNTVGKFLIPLGQNSLYVYIVHAFIIFFIDLAIPNKYTAVVMNIVINTSVLFVIWLMVKKKFLFKIIPR